ncbi:MAG: hypothetical protein ACPGWM_11335, partial [Flavobacteriales bacterium]
MKNILLISVSCSIALICCQNSGGSSSNNNNNNNNNEPEAFQQDYSLKRYSNQNLINKLYLEAIDDNSDLEMQEEAFVELMNSTPEVISDYHKFHQQQLEFYKMARTHLKNVVDSASKNMNSTLEDNLFKQLEKLVEFREKEFETLNSAHQMSLKRQEKLKKELRGQHDALELLYALKMM